MSGSINNLECSICNWFSGYNFGFLIGARMLLFGQVFRQDQIGTSQESCKHQVKMESQEIHTANINA